MRPAAFLIVLSSAVLAAQAPLLTPQQLAQFHGSYSESVEPFRIVGNVYYVGAKNIASYLITTRDGHMLIDTGTNEMGPVVRANVEKLGFKLTDIEIILSSHAHFDHIQGHAAMKKATGARVMAIREDAEALEAGKRSLAARVRGMGPGEGRSHAEGWRYGAARRDHPARHARAGAYARLHGVDDDGAGSRPEVLSSYSTDAADRMPV